MQSDNTSICPEPSATGETWEDIVSHPYSYRDAPHRLFHLLKQCEPFVQWQFNPNEVPSDSDHARLWEDERGNPVGVAAVEGPSGIADLSFLSFAVHPRMRGYVEPSIIAWAKGVARKLSPERPCLACRASVSDLLRIHVLEDHGFEYQSNADELFMACSLHETLSAPRIPPGYTIRPFSEQVDAIASTALVKKTLEGDLTVDKRRLWLTYPSYIPDLDLVVTAPDGTLAAYCVCNIFRGEKGEIEDDSAWILWLGTAATFRRRGLARALLQTALRGLQAHGCRKTLLSTNSDNTPAVRLFESFGFEVLYRMRFYVVEVK